MPVAEQVDATGSEVREQVCGRHPTTITLGHSLLHVVADEHGFAERAGGKPLIVHPPAQVGRKNHVRATAARRVAMGNQPVIESLEAGAERAAPQPGWGLWGREQLIEHVFFF